MVRSQGGARRSEPVARGRRSQARSGPGPWPQVAAHGLGAVLTGMAWFYLVGAATDFGVLAVRGQTPAWAFTIAASLGAVVCLLLFLVLVGRGLRTLGIVSDYQPRRAAPAGAARRRRPVVGGHPGAGPPRRHRCAVVAPSPRRNVSQRDTCAVVT